MKGARWFLHSEHGYMLRAPSGVDGYEAVVTALCLNTREYEEDRVLWEAHKTRLFVNAGSGAICADLMRVGDHNTDFRRVKRDKVPAHIRADFLAVVADFGGVVEDAVDFAGSLWL